MIAALSLEAFDGRIDPFMECIQQIRPHPGQIETGEIFRRLLHGSELIARTKNMYRTLTLFVVFLRCMGQRKMPSGTSLLFC